MMEFFAFLYHFSDCYEMDYVDLFIDGFKRVYE